MQKFRTSRIQKYNQKENFRVEMIEESKYSVNPDPEMNYAAAYYHYVHYILK